MATVTVLLGLFHLVKRKYRGALAVEQSSNRHEFERSSILVAFCREGYVPHNGMMCTGKDCY